MSGLFVVVSTGQNIANLPPLLEHAAAGDRVVWVESGPARRESWSRGAKVVLARKGFASLPDILVEEIDDLEEIVRASHSAVDLARRERLAVHVILNGGTKLTPLGLLRAWADLKPILLYGEQQPAVCKTFAPSLDRPAEVRPYTRHTLDLPEILEVSGHQVGDERGMKFWPGPLTEDLAREPYGVDEPATIEWQRRLHERGLAASPVEQPPPYRKLRSLLPDRLEVWKRSLPALAAIKQRELDADEPFRNIYEATLKLGRDAARAASRAGQALLPPLGPAFERAVARRTHAWLEATRHPAILSAWRGVKIAALQKSQPTAAEFDILLVLKNGVLWHLECKSFTAANKDLDARLFNLQKAGSKLAQMALCGPLFTGHVAEPWFAAQHDLRKRIEGRPHLAFIPFTLPGQSKRYQVEEAGVTQTFDCPALEDALEKALAAYRRAAP